MPTETNKLLQPRIELTKFITKLPFILQNKASKISENCENWFIINIDPLIEAVCCGDGLLSVSSCKTSQ